MVVFKSGENRLKLMIGCHKGKSIGYWSQLELVSIFFFLKKAWSLCVYKMIKVQLFQCVAEEKGTRWGRVIEMKWFEEKYFEAYFGKLISFFCFLCTPPLMVVLGVMVSVGLFQGLQK